MVVRIQTQLVHFHQAFQARINHVLGRIFTLQFRHSQTSRTRSMDLNQHADAPGGFAHVEKMKIGVSQAIENKQNEYQHVYGFELATNFMPRDPPCRNHDGNV